MATTHGWLASSTLDALADAGIGFAILHNEARVAADQVSSDVDIVVDRPARLLVSAVRWRGFKPVMLWTYDTGCASLFVALADGSGGAQIDMTWDTKGSGRYRLKADEIIDRAAPGQRWLQASGVDRSAYLSLKRDIKAGATRRTYRPARLVERLARPVGFWAHCADLDVAEAAELATLGGAFLPDARLLRPGLRDQVSLAWGRMLPRLTISHGTQETLLKPDVHIASQGVKDTAEKLVAAMATRLLSR